MALLKGPVFVGLLVMLALGCAMYLRLWSVQSQISLEDPQLIRLQFERAHNEALDESAEWRMKYDEEAERSRNYMQEVVEMKEVLEKKREENESLKGLLDTLQKVAFGSLIFHFPLESGYISQACRNQAHLDHPFPWWMVPLQCGSNIAKMWVLPVYCLTRSSIGNGRSRCDCL
ncbi:hypothetical protein AMTRI_Chr07g23660 [Amborella trichopoda]